MRGNQTVKLRGNGSAGSIPARAGEPRRGSARNPPGQVYPRACGGTSAPRSVPPRQLNGLSPRVRGNRVVHVVIDDNSRVYPRACGGTACASTAYRRQGTVYPRACGGTKGIGYRTCAMRGLSPRVRGNQPPMDNNTVTLKEVYPRACGGTEAVDCANRNWRRVYPRACGGTGYSAWHPRSPNNPEVYPRACGDTWTVGGTGSSRASTSSVACGLLASFGSGMR